MKSLLLLLAVFTLAACNAGKGTTTGNPITDEDDSVSGAAAQAVGGALSGSDSNGTQAMQKTSASLTNECPTFRTTTSECSASGSTMWLDYASCSFAQSRSTWNGTKAIIMSAGTAMCGSFPNPGASGTLIRQFVVNANAGKNTPGNAYITSRYSTIGVIDDHTANLSNFDNQTLATLVNGGYGDKVQFGAGGERTSVTVAHRIAVQGAYDHTLYGALSLSETAGAGTRMISGSIDVYHNGLKVVGTSTFTNVLHSDTCCVPISGSITTLFSAGVNVAPTALGALAVGKSETLTFTGCGTATHTRYDGTTHSVALSRCY